MSNDGTIGLKHNKIQIKDAGKAKASIYSTQTITIKFQYGLAITLQRLSLASEVIDVLHAMTKLPNLGANHAHFFV